jgi:hypothetical protein
MSYKQFIYTENAAKQCKKDHSQVEVMCEIPPKALFTSSGHTLGHMGFRPRPAAGTMSSLVHGSSLGNEHNSFA